MKEGRKPEYPEKAPGDELKKIYNMNSLSDTLLLVLHTSFSLSNMYISSCHTAGSDRPMQCC